MLRLLDRSRTLDTHLEHAVLEAGEDLFPVLVLSERDAPAEGAAAALSYVLVASPFLPLLGLMLAADDGQHTILGRGVHVLRLHARRFRLDH